MSDGFRKFERSCICVFTILFTLFLYAYIFSMYRKQKKGIVDYERYGYLALNDALEDELIEPRHKNAHDNGIKES